jgi:hypothetical protein
MTMVIGERKIVGQIKRRAEARSIYEQALLAGQTAALLEQERPNIFTQSVATSSRGRKKIIHVDVLVRHGDHEFPSRWWSARGTSRFVASRSRPKSCKGRSLPVVELRPRRP